MPSHLSTQERKVIEDCLRNLRSLHDCQAEYIEQETPAEHGRLHLRGPWGELTYQVITRMRLSANSAALTIAQLKSLEDHERPLLIADYLPEPVGSQLRRNRIDFIDTAGNALLCNPPLYVEVSGRRRRIRTPKPGRAFQTAGLKLIYLLLRNPRAVGWTYRELANATGIALGAIGPALQELCELNYLNDPSAPDRRLSGLEDLLARWEFGYGERLRPKLFRQTCRLGDGMTLTSLIDTIRRANLGERVLLGGEAGAQQLLQSGTARSASLHLGDDPLKTMLRLNLIPDPGGRIALIEQFSPANIWQGWRPEGIELADPLLLHAEIGLEPSADKTLAELLQQRYLEPMLNGRDGEPA